MSCFRHMTESDMISIIRFRSKIFGTEKSGVEQSTEALVQASFENPSFHREEDSESTGEERDTVRERKAGEERDMIID